MKEFISIPVSCRLHMPIPVDRLGFKTKPELLNHIEEIVWIGSLKPELWNVEAVQTPDDSFEEIQIIEITINSSEELYKIAQTVSSNISYKTLLIFRFGNKQLICGNYSSINKIESNKNTVRAICLSHWIQMDFLSKQGVKFVDTVNNIINNEQSLEVMYKEVVKAIKCFPLGGFGSRAAVVRLIEELTGKCSSIRRDRILASCSPYKYDSIKKSSRKITDRYKPRNVSSFFKYAYDKEDVWHCFMTDAELRNAIEKRRYRDIDELIAIVNYKRYDR